MLRKRYRERGGCDGETVSVGEKVGFSPFERNSSHRWLVHDDLLEDEGEGDYSLFPRCSALDILFEVSCISGAFDEICRFSEARYINKAIMETSAKYDIGAVHLFTAFCFESATFYWRHYAELPLERTRLHPIDVGIRVSFDLSGKIVVGKILSISFTKGKGLLAVVGIDESEVEVELSQLRPEEPLYLHLDVFLPCGEIVPFHGSPETVQRISLSTLYEKRKDLTAKQKVMASWDIADTATVAAAKARARFAMRPPAPLQLEVSIFDTVIDGVAYTVVQCQSLEHKVLRSHYEKLVRMFRVGGHPEGEFKFRLFSLLTRYFSLSGSLLNDEAGWHCAVPPRALKVLQQHLSVTAECFASPFNAFMRNYCSAFPDTDCWFGSLGSFFSFRPRCGSYEAGPPYDHQIIRDMFVHMVDLLQHAEGPLSFVVILPYSERREGKRILEAAQQSNYIVYDEQLPLHQDFAYVDGYQHLHANSSVKISCPTRIMVLQNSEAAGRWAPEDAMGRFKRAWSSSMLPDSCLQRE